MQKLNCEIGKTVPNKLNTPPLETERLCLRRFAESDLDALFQIYRDRAVNEFLPWYPLETPEEARQLYWERYAKAYRQPRGYRYAVCLKAAAAPIGYVHLEMDESHDLGYGLRRAYWGRGIISEAARAVLNRAKQDGLLYVTATHDVQNIRSGRVMQKLGMRYKYSYTEQWQPKNKPVTFRMYQLNFDANQDRTYWAYWNLYDKHFVETGLSNTAAAGKADG